MGAAPGGMASRQKSANRKAVDFAAPTIASLDVSNGTIIGVLCRFSAAAKLVCTIQPLTHLLYVV